MLVPVVPDARSDLLGFLPRHPQGQSPRRDHLRTPRTGTPRVGRRHTGRVVPGRATPRAVTTGTFPHRAQRRCHTPGRHARVGTDLLRGAPGVPPNRGGTPPCRGSRGVRPHRRCHPPGGLPGGREGPHPRHQQRALPWHGGDPRLRRVPGGRPSDTWPSRHVRRPAGRTGPRPVTHLPVRTRADPPTRACSPEVARTRMRLRRGESLQGGWMESTARRQLSPTGVAPGSQIFSSGAMRSRSRFMCPSKVMRAVVP